MKNNKNELLDAVVSVSSAYVAGNQVSAEDLPKLIRNVHQALFEVIAGEARAEPVRLKPAVAPRRSVKPEAIVCLEDGKKFRSLKKHLKVAHGLSPDDYRVKWDLGSAYPMVAPRYAATRSRLAKQAGFGRSAHRGRGKSAGTRAGSALTDAA